MALHDRRVLVAIPHIVAGLRDASCPVDVEAIARQVHTAPHYFRKIFRDATGDSVQRYVRRHRLDVAAYRLVFTDWPVHEVAARCGYSAHAPFTRAVREAFGSTPAELRRREPSAPWPLSGPSCTDLVEMDSGSCLLAFLRHFGNHASLAGRWRQLRDWLEAHGYEADAQRPLEITHDDPDFYQDSSIRFDVGTVVPREFVPADGIGLQVVPAQRRLRITHTGPVHLVPYTFMHLAVSAVMLGLYDGDRPPMPYQVEYERIPWCRPEVRTQAWVSLPLGPASGR
ncbi:GyrI-like domain-containing protein [Streptomyces sp. NPDC087440]|uniref:AraC family transcriptional regulator n=1 Tax=Streptomyces sp. NPDC087440 TaxID=3365790 RepID=UPI00380FF570